MNGLEEMEIGGVVLIALIIGWMQIAKIQFGLQGKALAITSIVVALVLGILAGAINEGLIPIQIVEWIEIVIRALAYVTLVLGAMGLHEWGKQLAGIAGYYQQQRR